MILVVFMLTFVCWSFWFSSRHIRNACHIAIRNRFKYKRTHIAKKNLTDSEWDMSISHIEHKYCTGRILKSLCKNIPSHTYTLVLNHVIHSFLTYLFFRLSILYFTYTTDHIADFFFAKKASSLAARRTSKSSSTRIIFIAYWRDIWLR